MRKTKKQVKKTEEKTETQINHDTSDKLLTIIKHWQKILRLQDWDISVAILRRSDMADVNNLAQNAVWTTSKISQIQVMHPEDWPLGNHKQDVEADIVHELIHLHLDGLNFKKGSVKWVQVEQSIECMTSALLGLRRTAAEKK